MSSTGTDEDHGLAAEVESDIRGWDAIVDHRTGTEGDRETAHWLAELLAAAGVEPQLVDVPFVRRVLHECSVAVDGVRIEGVPRFDAGFTGADGVTAPLCPLDDGPGDGAEIAVAPSAPLDGAPSAVRLRGAIDRGHAGIVAYSSAADVLPGLTLANANDYLAPHGSPVLQVSTEHGPALEAAAAAGSSAVLVAEASIEDTVATNVVATIAGRDRSLAPIVIMTPRSGWWTCTSERAGGIAAWLACARTLADRTPDRDVVFIASTGHELGHIGLDHQLDRAPDLVPGARAWIHLGANFAAVGSNLRYQASPDLHARGLQQLASIGEEPAVITPADQLPLGEAANIHTRGGSYLSLLGDSRWFHHPDDRWPDTIDLARTVGLTEAVVAMATALAGPDEG